MERERIVSGASTAASLLFAVGLQVSGYVNRPLSAVLVLSASAFATLAAKPEWARSRFRFQKLIIRDREPTAAERIEAGAPAVRLLAHANTEGERENARHERAIMRSTLDERERENRELSAQLDELRSKLADSEQQRALIAMACNNHERGEEIARSELTSVREELETTTQHCTGWKYTARKRFEVVRYGGEIEDLPSLNPHTHAAVIASLNQLRPFVERLWTVAWAWWNPIMTQALEHPESSLARALAWRMERCETEHVRHCRTAFFETLGLQEDARRWIAPMYMTYRIWRTEARRIAQSFGKMGDLSAYGEWRRAEVAFGTDLRRTLTHPALESAKERIESDEKYNGRIDDPLSG